MFAPSNSSFPACPITFAVSPIFFPVKVVREISGQPPEKRCFYERTADAPERKSLLFSLIAGNLTQRRVRSRLIPPPPSGIRHRASPFATVLKQKRFHWLPGGREGRPLSNMAFLMLLRRLGRDDLTAHGFRSTFRDWAAESTNFPAEVAEMALAHAVSDKVEAPYRRGDLFQKRRQLAEAWAKFCAAMPSIATVVPIRQTAAD